MISVDTQNTHLLFLKLRRLWEKWEQHPARIEHGLNNHSRKANRLGRGNECVCAHMYVCARVCVCNQWYTL